VSVVERGGKKRGGELVFNQMFFKRRENIQNKEKLRINSSLGHVKIGRKQGRKKKKEKKKKGKKSLPPDSKKGEGGGKESQPPEKNKKTHRSRIGLAIKRKRKRKKGGFLVIK